MDLNHNSRINPFDWNQNKNKGLLLTPFSVTFISREGNDPEDSDKITYRELLRKVCRFANVLESKGEHIVFLSFCHLFVYYPNLK